jgi:hypothetical protein
VGLGASGLVRTFNAGTWTGPVQVDVGNLLGQVSCASTTMCVAVDDEGGAVILNGTTWSSHTIIDPMASSITSSSAVSCASTTDCVAVFGEGNAVSAT